MRELRYSWHGVSDSETSDLLQFDGMGKQADKHQVTAAVVNESLQVVVDDGLALQVVKHSPRFQERGIREAFEGPPRLLTSMRTPSVLRMRR